MCGDSFVHCYTKGNIMKKVIHIIGGGTFNYVRAHLALATPAFGETAKRIALLCEEIFDLKEYEVRLHLTKMADPKSAIVTNDDVATLVDQICEDPSSKIIFMNAALTDYVGKVEDEKSAKYAPRLKTRDGGKKMELTPAPKLLLKVRSSGYKRKGIFLVAFKTTCNASSAQQYQLGLGLLKSASANLVLVNDIGVRNNMIVVPEEAVYHETHNREEVLHNLVDMVRHRSKLNFTKSTVVDEVMTPWSSGMVPRSLREVVDHCIKRGAYKAFDGKTAGHFAVKVGENQFLTSPRKRNFNDLNNIGLVSVEALDDTVVIAHGGKPSVGGQSQRIVFTEHEGLDCIVHFHSTRKVESVVPVVSQREYECGSHECGRNTSRGLKEVEPGIHAVYLDNHGPNIVFNRDVSSEKVIDFIERNFNLTEKSGGYEFA
jgi:hypothetical protein